MPTNSASARSLQGARTQQTCADEQDRGDRKQRHDGRVDGTDQRLVDGQVGRLGVRDPALPQDPGGVLADLVEDHDSVVERIAQDGQHTDGGCRGVTSKPRIE